MEADGAAAIGDLARGCFDVLGELGPDDAGNAVWLARGLTDSSLVALRMDPSGGTRRAEARLRVSHELDASLPAGWTACPVCRKTIQWRRYCSGCGADLYGLEATAAGGAPASELVERVVTAAGARYEILGSMQRAEAGATVVFARTRATGELVALSPREDVAGEPNSQESLGVTRFSLSDPNGGGELPASEAAVVEVSARPIAGAPASPDTPGVEDAAGEEMKVCPVCGSEYGGGLRFCPQDASILQPKRQGDDHSGRVIGGRYHVLEKIGEGGMGQVYLAEHIMMRRRCALKMIKPGLARCVDSVSRFSREANNASRISHPNVAIIYDFGEADGGELYLAMEYVDGESLASLVGREPSLPVARTVEIARQVADALTAAHNIGMVHRDLKPDNILLARDMGGEHQVKVVDFGIAKGLGGEDQDITRTGFVVGTPRYMSPEQLMGEAVDGRSDLYSLGCILYEMLTGELPFGGAESAATLTRRLFEPPPHPHERNPGVSRELSDLVVRTLARLPEERFQTAAELRDALAGLSAGAVPGRRRRYASFVLGGLGVLLLGATIAVLVPVQRSTPPRLPEQLESGRPAEPDAAHIAEPNAAAVEPESDAAAVEPEQAGPPTPPVLPPADRPRADPARPVVAETPSAGATAADPPALPLGTEADFGRATEAELLAFGQALETRQFDVIGRLMRAEQVDRLRNALAEPGALRAEAKIISSFPDRETVVFFVEVVDAATGRPRYFGGYRALFVPVPGSWKLADVTPDQ